MSQSLNNQIAIVTVSSSGIGAGVANVMAAAGAVNILINNAGLQRDAPFTELTLERWNTVIGVNLTGQFLCAREAIKEFLRRGIIEEKSIASGKDYLHE